MAGKPYKEIGELTNQINDIDNVDLQLDYIFMLNLPFAPTV